MRPITQAPLRVNSTTSTMAKKGINLRDLPQFLSPDNALDIKNFLIVADGGLAKRKGFTEFFDTTGTNGIKMVKRYTDDLWLIGFGTTLAYYRESTDSVTNIKTDFVASGEFDGEKYGDYFFVASPLDSLGRVSQTLAYDGQTVNFTVGAKVTGGTSGATAIILQDSDSGATGTLTLGSVSGTFQNNEVITDDAGGTADVNGVIALTYTAISGSPKAYIVRAIGNRLYCGACKEDLTQVWYSEVDTSANPPFTTWTVGTTSTSPGKINYRNAGRVRAIEPLGNLILVFGDEGKWAFSVDTIDSGGTLKKVDVTAMFRNDLGGARGAISCKAGLFYVNEQGLWQLVAVGQQNIKYSDQEAVVSVLLGTKYFDDVDFSQCDMAYMPKEQTLLVTCAKDSAQNNLVLTYNTEFKAMARFTGWNINRFYNDEGTLYGASTSGSNKVYQLFDGYSDNGADIWAEYYQEIRTGGLEQNNELIGQYVQGYLSGSSEVTMAFDIYDYTGRFVPNKLRLSWDKEGDENISDGYGIASWGTGSIGSDVETAGLVEAFDGFRGRISNYQRLRVRFTEHSKLPLIINYFTIETRGKRNIRRRKMTQL